jgi:hypothetical protein
MHDQQQQYAVKQAYMHDPAPDALPEQRPLWNAALIKAARARQARLRNLAVPASGPMARTNQRDTRYTRPARQIQKAI